ncbi:MAG: universal stress protein [Pseudomonadota bacterium]
MSAVRGPEVDTVCNPGRVAQSVIDFTAAHKPHILVIGAASRPRWAHAVASGTAAQILQDVDCDLLVVKPPGFVSPLLVTDE